METERAACWQPGTMLTALHYLFSRSASGSKIVAHCLDLDLVTSGENQREAEDRLNGVVLQQIRDCYTTGNFYQLCFKAPVEFWNTLSEARELPRVHLEAEVPLIALPVKRCVVSLQVYRHDREAAMQAA